MLVALAFVIIESQIIGLLKDFTRRFYSFPVVILLFVIFDWALRHTTRFSSSVSVVSYSHLMRLQTRDRKTERQPTFHRWISAHLRTGSQSTSAHSQSTFLVNWQTSPCSQPTCLLWICKTPYLLSTNFTSVNHTGLLSLWWNSAYRSKQINSNKFQINCLL